MEDPLPHRAFKGRLYAQLARIGKALSSPHRLEFLELLAQAERRVESLAVETGLSVANASQHLQILREAGLVETRRQGVFVHYRLADGSVVGLTGAVRTVAERRLAELDKVVREHFSDRQDAQAVRMADLVKRLNSGKVVILDARPENEYEAGHIAGALSAPVETLRKRLKELPRSKEFVAYCRGPYCVYADRAVELLRASGRRARRLEAGLPEWKASGYPVEIGASKGA
jgi:rhodanese-related sulfurtransferase